MTPDCAAPPRRGVEGHESWPGFYRRGTEGTTARGSGRVSSQLACTGRHSAEGLMTYKKTSMVFVPCWSFVMHLGSGDGMLDAVMLLGALGVIEAIQRTH